MSDSPTVDELRNASDSKKAERLPRTVWILSIVSLLADVSSEMVYPLLPLFLISVMGSSRMQLGVMEGGAAFIVALISALAGIRSDRKETGCGRVVWIRWGYGLPVIGKSVIALATIWPLFLGGRLLDRFGKGLRGAPRDALIADAVMTHQRGRAFGLHRACDTAGALIGVLLSAFLLWWLAGTPHQMNKVAGELTETPVWIYRVIFGLGSVLGLGSLILTLFVRESESNQPGTADAALDHEEKKTEDSVASEPTTGWLRLPTSYWSILGVLTLFSLANSSDTFLLLRAHEFGFSSWTVVLLYAIYNVSYSALSYPAGALSDKLGRWRIISVGWMIYAGVYAGFALLPNSQAWGLWPLMTAYGVYMALTDGVGKALIADQSSRQTRGAAMGVFYSVTGLTTLVSSLLAGYLWDHSGPAAAFMFSATFAIIAIIALLIVRQRLI